MEVIISTPSSTHSWTRSHDLFRMHLTSFLARRGVNIGEGNITFVEGDSDQAGLVLESSPDLCRLALSTCLNEWNALLRDDDEFSERLREWSERDARKEREDGRTRDPARSSKMVD